MFLSYDNKLSSILAGLYIAVLSLGRGNNLIVDMAVPVADEPENKLNTYLKLGCATLLELTT